MMAIILSILLTNINAIPTLPPTNQNSNILKGDDYACSKFETNPELCAYYKQHYCKYDQNPLYDATNCFHAEHCCLNTIIISKPSPKPIVTKCSYQQQTCSSNTNCMCHRTINNNLFCLQNTNINHNCDKYNSCNINNHCTNGYACTNTTQCIQTPICLPYCVTSRSKTLKSADTNKQLANPTHIPTPAPTTFRPTTEIPVISPTIYAPTTEFPTTTSPTMYPTIPTYQPTIHPASIRHPTTENPTISPTTQPTINPSFIPTNNPTKYPTHITLEPTMTPTIPSQNPTKYPTNIPTIPSNNPTNIPTMTPTNPTQNPTPLPTPNPTKYPTNAPTISTEDPTPHPTPNPTRFPTRQPTDITISPSNNPSKSPSNNPTFDPTDFPTPQPTPRPSEAPTKSPVPNEPIIIQRINNQNVENEKQNGNDNNTIYEWSKWSIFGTPWRRALVFIIADMGLIIVFCMTCIVWYDRKERKEIEEENDDELENEIKQILEMYV